ncbi:glycoside hydrolase family 18 protein [Moniliophthora roreri MCA 2997]|uniref:Glycoside hydrolase family 18 protein n=1 Tax=Moniliophthora roreri (strain MCA 2997) TaxID=1381753 RepID=V2XN44_MONRO|nr:glycoside hydrolase family 18 protein [Moniliophthora roreri MCA 2997]
MLALAPSALLLFSLLAPSQAIRIGLDFSLKAKIQDSEKVAAAWYAGWHSDEGFPLSSVPWDKYTYLTYSFAETTEDTRLLTLNKSNPEVLPQFVKAAHEHGVGALVSLGGWAGSRFFSTAVATPENRTTFVNTVVSLAQEYSLDGIDFDWEYPNNQGIGCNAIAVNDTVNFLLFLQELRQHPVGSQLLLTAATSITPFRDAEGNPSEDVSAFAEVLDYIAVMNYDIWGSWSVGVGPNAPLNDTCAAPENQQGSAVLAINAWTAAGIPASQLILGVPGYGHSFTVNQTAAFKNGSDTELASYPAFNASVRQQGDAWDDEPGPDVCGVEQPYGGNFNFWSIIKAGYLNEDGTPKDGVPYRFDECSRTAYVYDAERQLMISFDDVPSFAAKGKFIADMGLAGFALWEAGGDYNSLLLDSIRDAAGIC